MDSMSSFVSIIKLDSGAASYKVVERTQNDYIAYLVRNTTSQPLPQELSIDALRPHENGDPVKEKLLTAIKNNTFLDDGLA